MSSPRERYERELDGAQQVSCRDLGNLGSVSRIAGDLQAGIDSYASKLKLQGEDRGSQRGVTPATIASLLEVLKQLSADRELRLELWIGAGDATTVAEVDRVGNGVHDDLPSLSEGASTPSDDRVGSGADTSVSSGDPGDPSLPGSPDPDSSSHAIYTTGAVALRDWIDRNQVSVRGATPSMLSGVVVNAVLDVVAELRGEQV